MLLPKMCVVAGLYVEREIGREREMLILKMCVVAGLYVEMPLLKMCVLTRLYEEREIDAATEDVCCCWTICGESG